MLPINLKTVETAYQQATTKITHEILPAVKNQVEFVVEFIKKASQNAIKTLVHTIKNPLKTISNKIELARLKKIKKRTKN